MTKVNREHRLTILMDEEIFQKFYELCKKKDTHPSDKVRRLIKKWIGKQEKSNAK